MCCLDREQTPSYGVQVVATDGGGLKGKEELRGEGYSIVMGGFRVMGGMLSIFLALLLGG